MTTLIPHKYKSVIEAWAEGRSIQCRCATSARSDCWPFDPVWCDNLNSVSDKFGTPMFNHPDLEWRVAPTKKSGWINIYDDNTVSRVYASDAHAEAEQPTVQHGRSKAIIFIEWEE